MPFASRLKENIQVMREEIRVGTYRFNKLRMAPIPKPSGGYRIIAIPTIRDRLVQRALLRHLEGAPRFRAVSEISFGFTKGRTLADAQRRALVYRQQYPWVLQADIVKFFDNIRRSDIKKLITRKVRRMVVAELLCAAVDSELEDGGGRGAEIVQAAGIQKGRGLRQGMPVSPMLSNLLLLDFDETLASRGIVAIRYADDVAIFANNANECRDALAIIQQNLARIELKIPELVEGGKTVLSDPSKPVEFLGLEIKRFGQVYKLCTPNKKLQQIESDMAAIASIDRCIKEKQNIGHVVRSLDSFVIGHKASMTVLDDFESFLQRLEAAKRKHLNSLLISLIGSRAVEALDDSCRSVLGLQPFNS
jgi:RNA-directed DNA polymerase